MQRRHRRDSSGVEQERRRPHLAKRRFGENRIGGIAGNDRDALEIVAQLVRDAGFDPVIVGPLARGKEFEPDTPPYNTGMSGRDLRTLFGQSG